MACCISSSWLLGIILASSWHHLGLDPPTLIRAENVTKTAAVTCVQSIGPPLPALGAQMAASQFCLIFKGVPQVLVDGRETHAELWRVFGKVLKELDLQKVVKYK